MAAPMAVLIAIDLSHFGASRPAPLFGDTGDADRFEAHTRLDLSIHGDCEHAMRWSSGYLKAFQTVNTRQTLPTTADDAAANLMDDAMING